MAAAADDLALAFLDIDGKAAAPPRVARLKLAARRSARDEQRRREVAELFDEAAAYYHDDHPCSAQASSSEDNGEGSRHYGFGLLVAWRKSHDDAVGDTVLLVNENSAKHDREAGLGEDSPAARWLRGKGRAK